MSTQHPPLPPAPRRSQFPSAPPPQRQFAPQPHWAQATQQSPNISYVVQLTNGVATTALVFGILSWVFPIIGFVFAIVAVALGVSGLSKWRQIGVGRASALWGLWLGIIPLAGYVVLILVLVMSSIGSSVSGS